MNDAGVREAVARRLHRLDLFREYPHLDSPDLMDTTRVEVDWNVCKERWLALADPILPLLEAGDALLAGYCFCSDKPVEYDGCKDHKMQGIYCIEHGECPPCKDYAAWLAARTSWTDPARAKDVIGSGE